MNVPAKFFEKHSFELPDGRKTNAYYEWLIRKHFEKYCELAGFEPYEEVELRSEAVIGKRILGRAHVSRHEKWVAIDFNKVKKYEEIEQEIEETIAHEVAHIACPYTVHGLEWCELMIKWGFKPSTTATGKKRN